MSDALMILPAAVAAAGTPAPAAPAPTTRQPLESSRVPAPGAGPRPVPAEAPDTDSAETAAQFSEVLACVVNSFMAVPQQPNEIVLPETTCEPSVTEGIDPSASLSLWNLVPVVPEDADAAQIPAEELQTAALDPATKELFARAVEALATNEKAAPEQLAGQSEKATGKEPQRLVPELVAEPVMEGALKAAATTETLGARTEKMPLDEAGNPVKPAQTQAVEQVDNKLPREAKIVADTTIEPVAPKETTASSTRVVETATAQTQDEAVTEKTHAGTGKAVTARPVPSNVSSADSTKVSVNATAEMAEGSFATLRPATSAPGRSVAERQALPAVKAEPAGNDFNDTQRAIAQPATETQPAESIEKASDSKLTAASPARQVSEAVQTAQRSNVRVLEMELKPEGLGTLRLKLSGPVRGASGEGLQLEIQALNPKAHALLLDHLTELRSALGQWEIRIMPPVAQNFGGVLAGSESRGFAQSGSQRQSGQQQTNHNAPDKQTDESFSEQFGSSLNG